MGSLYSFYSSTSYELVTLYGAFSRRCASAWLIGRFSGEIILGSKWREHVQAVLLQGIALGGFNVVDVHALAAALGRPVLVVARKEPDLAAIRAALGHVPNGPAKWARIQTAGPMEACAGVWVQRAGLSFEEAEATLRLHARHGRIPEPLRAAHRIAGGLATGQSRGRV